MNQEKLSIVLAIAIFVLSVPILLRARRAIRTKSARRISGFAQHFGMEELDPEGPRMLPLFEWGSVLDPASGHSVVSAIGGAYLGLEILLAEVELNTDRSSMGRFRPSWTSGRLRSKGRRLAGWIGPRGLADHLIIFFVEPLPRLPDFRIEPSASRVQATGPDPGVAEEWAGEGSGEALLVFPPEARGSLPGAFLDRASRVLVGRRQSWAIEGAGHRLAIRLSGWRPRSDLRSYRAVLDDALSLRDALTSVAEAPAPDGESGSIRTALERIRKASAAPVDHEWPDETAP